MCRWEDIRMDLRGNRVGGCGLDATGSGYGPLAGPCEHDNETSGSIKILEILIFEPCYTSQFLIHFTLTFYGFY